jgi:hypothetical protein
MESFSALPEKGLVPEMILDVPEFFKQISAEHKAGCMEVYHLPPLGYVWNYLSSVHQQLLNLTEQNKMMLGQIKVLTQENQDTVHQLAMMKDYNKELGLILENQISHSRNHAIELKRLSEEVITSHDLSELKDHTQKVELRLEGVSKEVLVLKECMEEKTKKYLQYVDKIPKELKNPLMTKETQATSVEMEEREAPMLPHGEERLMEPHLGTVSQRPGSSWAQKVKGNLAQERSDSHQDSCQRPITERLVLKSPKPRSSSRKVTLQPMSNSFQKETSEGPLQRLLKKSALEPPRKTDQVLSRVVSIPFKSTAALSSLKSWKQLIRQFLGPDIILNVSVIHPTKAQIFYDVQDAGKVDEFLKKVHAVDATHKLKNQDIIRLAAAYLRGYFKPLRKAVIEDLEKDIREKVLTKAEELIGSQDFFQGNQVRQLMWKHWVAQDKKERAETGEGPLAQKEEENEEK